ncbi:hypothetical protein [Pseudoalteromonas sp. Of7M-16]|uniref:hypothetical protein n=1 Tax=Pseudoalteromonas sp. Of7M-16 TaxID=2917756 RepID=UPI001EF3E962|nr:hypothetical protein [Pseudoalteromonas sp. Of7M-16]MCG7550938.1 hypothetical protein [Pseudoalteromonas sp. Of7M-16]
MSNVSITPPTAQELANMPLLAHVQHYEPRPDVAINSLLKGLFPSCVVKGFKIEPNSGLSIKVKSAGGFALVHTSGDELIKITGQKDLVLSVPAGTRHVYLKANFSYGTITKQVNTGSHIESAEIQLTTSLSDSYGLYLGTVTVPSGAGAVTNGMIDTKDVKEISIEVINKRLDSIEANQISITQDLMSQALTQMKAIEQQAKQEKTAFTADFEHRKETSEQYLALSNQLQAITEAAETNHLDIESLKNALDITLSLSLKNKGGIHKNAGDIKLLQYHVSRQLKALGELLDQQIKATSDAYKQADTELKNQLTNTFQNADTQLQQKLEELITNEINALNESLTNADTQQSQTINSTISSLRTQLTTAYQNADTSLKNQLESAINIAILSLEEALTDNYIAADGALNQNLTTAYQNADNALKTLLRNEFKAADTAVTNAYTSAINGAIYALEESLTNAFINADGEQTTSLQSEINAAKNSALSTLRGEFASADTALKTTLDNARIQAINTLRAELVAADTALKNELNGNINTAIYALEDALRIDIDANKASADLGIKNNADAISALALNETKQSFTHCLDQLSAIAQIAQVEKQAFEKANQHKVESEQASETLNQLIEEVQSAIESLELASNNQQSTSDILLGFTHRINSAVNSNFNLVTKELLKLFNEDKQINDLISQLSESTAASVNELNQSINQTNEAVTQLSNSTGESINALENSVRDLNESVNALAGDVTVNEIGSLIEVKSKTAFGNLGAQPQLFEYVGPKKTKQDGSIDFNALMPDEALRYVNTEYITFLREVDYGSIKKVSQSTSNVVGLAATVQSSVYFSATKDIEVFVSLNASWKKTAEPYSNELMSVVVYRQINDQPEAEFHRVSLTTEVTPTWDGGTITEADYKLSGSMNLDDNVAANSQHKYRVALEANSTSNNNQQTLIIAVQPANT